MKKLFAIWTFLTFALGGFAQETHFDFSVTNATGYDIYYRIVNAENQQVEVTYPCLGNGNYWWGYIKPEGKLMLSDTVNYNGTAYAVVAIGDHAFCGCSDLRGELDFPQTINAIGAGAFKGCSNLNGNLSIPAAIMRIEDETFSGCSSLSGKLMLPDSTHYVGSQAFLNCSGFRGMMMLPSTLTFIGDAAFKGCTSINSMSVKTTTIPSTAVNAFDEIPTWITVHVPYNMKEAYQNAPGWSRFATHTVEKSVWNGHAEPWKHGSGTSDDPYLIESAENLAWLAQSVNERKDIRIGVIEYWYDLYFYYDFYDVHVYQDTCFKLVIDVDLRKNEGVSWKPIGHHHHIDENEYIDETNPHYHYTFNNYDYHVYFSGQFDGGSHEISNYGMYDSYWTKDAVNGYYRGLFGIISDCSIYDLTINNLNINSQSTSKIIGGLTGRAINSTISNCHTSGLIKSGNVDWSNPINTIGGIIGFAENCLIQNCSVLTTIDACTQTHNQTGTTGGIVGTMINDTQFERKSRIIHCSFNGSIVNSCGCAGGIVGLCDGSLDDTGVIRIENCYSRGAMVRAIGEEWGEIRNLALGGIVGKVADIDTLFILNCYSNDTITGNSSTASNVNSYAGGLIAKADATTILYIKNCYHVGPISSKYKGGILAQNTNMTIVRNCFFEAGCAPDDGFGVPFDSDYMKTEAFVNRLNNGSSVYRMDREPFENNGYPIFGNDGLIFVGAEWYYEILGDDGSITYQHLQCVGDTTINSERPKVIVRSNTQYDRDSIHTEVTHEYVYEENGVVYWWNKILGKFTVLYDFGAEVGDEWTIEVDKEAFTTHVYETEIHYIEGIPYKKLTIIDPSDNFSGSLLSSIGHLTSFFPEKLMSRGKGYRVEGLRCYWLDDELVYKLGDEDCDAIYAEWHKDIEENENAGFVVYPNPANHILFVEMCHGASLTDQTYRITNLMGQMVRSSSVSAKTLQIDIENLPAGMYFITFAGETRKFVVR